MECSLPRVLLLLALLVGVDVVVGVEETPNTGKPEHGEHVKETHYSEGGEHNDAFDHQSILGKKILFWQIRRPIALNRPQWRNAGPPIKCT